jgi:hypothetical protein
VGKKRNHPLPISACDDVDGAHPAGCAASHGHASVAIHTTIESLAAVDSPTGKVLVKIDRILPECLDAGRLPWLRFRSGVNHGNHLWQDALDAVDDELNGDGGQNQAHQPGRDVEARRAHELLDSGGVP